MARSDELVESISSRGDLVSFIRSLQREFEADPAAWENNSLGSFLEALAAWTDDMDGYMANAGRPRIDQPSWRTFAEMLIAARVYE